MACALISFCAEVAQLDWHRFTPTVTPTHTPSHRHHGGAHLYFSCWCRELHPIYIQNLWILDHDPLPPYISHKYKIHHFTAVVLFFSFSLWSLTTFVWSLNKRGEKEWANCLQQSYCFTATLDVPANPHPFSKKWRLYFKQAFLFIWDPLKFVAGISAWISPPHKNSFGAYFH